MRLFPKRAPDVVVVLPNLAEGGAQIQGLLLAHDLRGRGLGVLVALTHSSQTTAGNSRDLAGLDLVYVPGMFSWRDFGEILMRSSRKLAGLLGLWWVSDRIKDIVSTSVIRRLRSETGLTSLPKRHLRVLISARNLRRFIKARSPKLVVSLVVESNVVALIASEGLAPCVVMERSDYDRQPVSTDLRSIRIDLYQEAVMVCANSRNTQRQLERDFPSTRVEFFPNSYRERCQPASPPTERTILFVGRLEAQKDPLGALEGFHSSGLWREGWSLVFVGTGALLGRLKERSGELQISKRVRIVGAVDKGEIPFYSGSFLILNSLYEGSPNVLAECIAAGMVPLVRATVLEAREFIPPVLRRRLFYRDVEQLGERLGSLDQLTEEYLSLVAILQEAYSRTITQYASQRIRVLSMFELLIDSDTALRESRSDKTEVSRSVAPIPFNFATSHISDSQPRTGQGWGW